MSRDDGEVVGDGASDSKSIFIGLWSMDSHDIRSRRGWRREILSSLFV
jgi:hypothetical protein